MSAALQDRPASTASAVEPSFIAIPETTLPSGRVVPAFSVGQYLCGRGTDGKAVISYSDAPWTCLTYDEARVACAARGWQLISETQWLAIAHLIAQQPENWTREAVGQGALYQGLRKGKVSSAQPASAGCTTKTERRWHALPGGERIYDFAGNAYSWVFDDVQGDTRGLTAKKFTAESPSLSTAPYPPLKKGVGWYPRPGADWSGHALIRGGCWGSESDAGVFRLSDDWPDGAFGGVGFRCTQPGL